MDAIQIAPNHADHISGYREKYLEEMIKNELVIAQPKYDGERMLIHVCKGQIFCTSRRHSKKTDRYMENQDKLPVLKEILKPILDLDYTVIDCECYAKDWSTIVGILHSLPERAIELQKEDEAKFACFDCLWYDGKELSTAPYMYRLQHLFDILKVVNHDNFHFVQLMNKSSISTTLEPVESLEDIYSRMNLAIKSGFEGIVVKSMNRTYYEKGASLKVKKFETLDVVVCGYQQGRGKYADTIGALEIGYYDEDKDEVIRISRVNCGTDEERDLWRDNWEEWKNTVIEVKCQEVTEKSLRHPVYIRRREDKDYKSCTRETIFKN